MRPARLASAVSVVLGLVGACGGHTDTLGTTTSGAAAGSSPAGGAGAGTGGAQAASGETGGAVGGIAGAAGRATSGAGGAGGGATSGAGGTPGASGGAAGTAGGSGGFAGGGSGGGGGAGVGGDDGLQASPWPMYHHDPRHTGRSMLKGPATGHIKWQRQANAGEGGATQAGPPVVAADGTIYSVFNSVLHALDMDGKDKCVFKSNGALLDMGSSPAIGKDGTVYFGTQSKDATGDFYAVAPDCTGKWTLPFAGGVSVAPVIAGDGTIYVSANSSLHAVSPSGTVQWTLDTSFIEGAPGIGLDGSIYLPVDAGIHALRPDGTSLWKTSAYAAGGSVSVAPDGMIYSGIDSLYAIRPEDGTAVWGYGLPNETLRDCPAFGADGTIYAPFGTKGLHALAPDGTLKWKADLPANGSPVVDGDGNIYIGAASLSKDGATRWFVESIGGRNAALASDGVMLVAEMPGAYLYAFSTGP